MHAPRPGAARVVAAVSHDGVPLVLVEDSWVTESEWSPPESRRTWSSIAGDEVKTVTSPASAESLGLRVTAALAGAAMERSISAGAPREAMIVAVRRAQGADVREDAICLVVDGEPYSGLTASSDGTTVRGTVVDQMVVMTIGGGDPVSLTLGSSDRC